ncbi:MAG: Dna2/Cas4 domain-containing protein, partial [Thiovulaceae bacterium]|nr:Dna2/Cas4 domain-containing protein [Sulfurimonadaceae bacterium]
AILTWQNKDGLRLEEALKAEGIDVVTETNSRLIHHPSVSGLIELLKFYYFNKPIYFENFKALLGLEEVPVVCLDLKALSLKSILHQLIKAYNIFNGDQNIIKFLDIVVAYKDIDQLIFEITTQGESLTRLDQSGVRVLTVHKSKGLEFGHVISMDRLGKKNADRSLILYHYDKTMVKQMFLRQKGRELFDTTYKNAKSANDKMVFEDELNAMYVAFTRAEESLYIIKKPKSSIFEPLELELKSYGQLLQTVVHAKAKASLPEFEYRPVSLGLQEVNRQNEKETFKDYEAIEFGLALHYTLEMLSDFSLAALPTAMTALNNRYNLNSEKVTAISKRVKGLINNEHFQELCSAQINKEQPLSVDGKLYYIDLLIKHENHYVVIDYKSSKEGMDEHLKQLRNYIYGVNNITNLPVIGYIAYVLDQKSELVKVD